jgi:hypothetical protein
MNIATRIPITEDDPDLTFLAAREWAEDQFHEWQREGIRGLRECDNNPREDEDFSAWLVRMAQPHMVDCERFAAAMDWSERGLLSDARLIATARDHKKFNRLNRREGGRS